jgi:hypothetical protein
VAVVAVRSTNAAYVVLAGAGVGVLGGLIGLGGAEFRLPLRISMFGFAALSAVILNKAMSLIVVLTALPARLAAIPYEELSPHWNVVVNLLAGSLLGAWMGDGRDPDAKRHALSGAGGAAGADCPRARRHPPGHRGRPRGWTVPSKWSPEWSPGS